MEEIQTNSEWKSILVGEILIFEFLGRIVYQELDQEWLNQIIQEDIFDEVPFGGEQEHTKKGLEMLQTWADDHHPQLEQEAFDDLRAEYMRLFVGTGKVQAAPWESVHFSEERLVFQESTLDVRGWYRKFGLEPEKIHQEPDDHIGLEMLFVAHLASLALEALEQENEEQFNHYLSSQKRFLEEHLLKWGTYWASLVEKNAQTKFYRGLAYLVTGALLSLSETFGILISKELIL